MYIYIYWPKWELNPQAKHAYHAQLDHHCRAMIKSPRSLSHRQMIAVEEF